MTTGWTTEHLEALGRQDIARQPKLAAEQIKRPCPDLYYWDMWPVADRNGDIANVYGRELWMVLTAPDDGNFLGRHFAAKIHLLTRRGEEWDDLGPLLPDFRGPYEREWSGSAIWHNDRFTLWFTGAGLREAPGGYQQALFETSASTRLNGLPGEWNKPRQILGNLTADYIAADAHEGEAGRIKAYRDPAYFCNPADDKEYLVFTASHAADESEYTGAIGLAEKVDGEWELLPPLVHAGALNNEMERAHVVYHNGKYLVFWATQSSTFIPDLRHAPTGLYGMIADTLLGPYVPLNGSGLVLANPEDRPSQNYSWSVTRELLVSSFVQCTDKEGKSFTGAPAPLVQLAVDIDRATASLMRK